MKNFNNFKINENSQFSMKEIVELITAYQVSDSGTFSIEEVKKIWPNSFDSMTAHTQKWLDNIATKSIDERAHEWWNERDEDFQDYLKNQHKNSTVTEIYLKAFLITSR